MKEEKVYENDFVNLVLAGSVAIPALPASIVAGIWYGVISFMRISSAVVCVIIAMSIIPFIANYQMVTYLLGWITLCFDLEITAYPGQVTWAKVILSSIPAGLAAGGTLHLLFRDENKLKKKRKPEEEN